MAELPTSAAIYTRLSTEEQVRGEYTSLEHQEQLCRRLIEDKGWYLLDVYEDRGISGGNPNRPEYLRLQADIAARKVNAVVTYKLERICRDAGEGLRFYGFAAQHGCMLVSVTEPMDSSTPIGKLNTTMAFGFAEYERNNNSAKVKSKQLESAQRGYKTGGNYPFGYMPSSKPGVPGILEEEAAIVRMIFAWIVEGQPIKELVVELNKRGVRTRAKEVKRRGGEQKLVGGNPLRSDQVRAIIRNPMYKGFVQYKDILTKGKFEAIIDETLWAAANKQLEKQDLSNPARVQERDRWFHPLKGLLVCGNCGTALTPCRSGKMDSSGKPFRYYGCQVALGRKESDTCSGCRLPAGLIEQIVARFLGEISKHSEMIESILGASKKASTYSKRQIAKERNLKRKELESIKTQITNLQDVALKVGTGGFSKDLIEKARELEQKREGILAEIHFLDRQTEQEQRAETSIQDIQEALSRFDQVLATLPEAEQKELYNLMVERTTLTKLESPGQESFNSDQEFRVDIQFSPNLELVGAHRAKPASLRVTVSRSRSLWATVSGPISLEIGKPRPKKRRKTAPRAKHPVHEALKIHQILHKKGWTAAEYARQQGITRAAVTKILNWLKLESECQEILFNLKKEKWIRLVSQSRLRNLRELTGKAQVEALLELLRKGGWDG